MCINRWFLIVHFPPRDTLIGFSFLFMSVSLSSSITFIAFASIRFIPPSHRFTRCLRKLLMRLKTWCGLFVKGSASQRFENKVCMLRRKTDFKGHDHRIKVRMRREGVAVLRSRRSQSSAPITRSLWVTNLSSSIHIFFRSSSLF